MKRDWEVALKPKKQKSNGPQHRLTDGMLKDHEILDCFPVYLRLYSMLNKTNHTHVHHATNSYAYNCIQSIVLTIDKSNLNCVLNFCVHHSPREETTGSFSI